MNPRGTATLPWASPPLVSTAMDLPDPDRFSMSFRVSCRFGAMVLAMCLRFTGLSVRGRPRRNYTRTWQARTAAETVGIRDGEGGGGGGGVVALQWLPPSKGTYTPPSPPPKILAMVKMTDSEAPKARHRRCVHAGVIWWVWTKFWGICSQKTFIDILLNVCVSWSLTFKIDFQLGATSQSAQFSARRSVTSSHVYASLAPTSPPRVTDPMTRRLFDWQTGHPATEAEETSQTRSIAVSRSGVASFNLVLFAVFSAGTAQWELDVVRAWKADTRRDWIILLVGLCNDSDKGLSKTTEMYCNHEIQRWLVKFSSNVMCILLSSYFFL